MSAIKSIDVPLVELFSVNKRFGGTQALNGVSLRINAGEIHGFVGENGAGKSTLGKVIAGLYHADSGELRVDGSVVQKWDPARAQREGIVMIAQELALVPELTVAENVFLGTEEHWAGITKRNLSARFAELDELVGFAIDPNVKVKTLRLADQQKVEILRSLARKSRLIVMDEPTSSLTAHETAQLHELMKKLTARGCTIVYVSHFLDAVLEVSDQITVMREGELVRSAPAVHETKKSLVEAMLGRALDSAYPSKPPKVDSTIAPSLSVSHLSTNTGVVDVSFDVRPGEIVGLLGLVGSGRSESVRAIIGADLNTGGVVTFEGRSLTRSTPRTSIMDGLMFVPEDRHKDGLVLMRTVRENMCLAQPKLFSRLGVINARAEKKAAQALVERLQIRPPLIELPVSGFSGGNQQKVLLAKVLIRKPKFIIFDEPTRGVDIGAKFAIYQTIVELAAQNIGVLLVSSEHEEILELCHRAYLVSRGRTIDEILPDQTTVDQVLYKLFQIDKPDVPKEKVL